MNHKQILIIEDEPDILELVQYNLERQGYRVHTSIDGESGVADAIKRGPDLIVLDIMLPGIDGLEVCKRLRENATTKATPILMLTAKSEESDIVVGLELGADDYMTKPFSPRELVARIRALLRRTSVTGATKAVETDEIAVGPLKIDSVRHETFCRGKNVSLTLAEFKLLRALARAPGRVFTRDQLLEKVAGADTYLIDRNIDVHIRSIRKKLQDDSDMIVTIRGVGYKCKEFRE